MSRAVRRLVPCLLLAVCASGCIDRARLNTTCEWTGDSAFPLDLNNPADRRHLIADAQLAEGLAVKFADTEHRRRFGYGGHGGLIDHGRVLHECMTTLVGVIERTHGVSAGAVDEARAIRDPRFDVPVLLSFAAFYAVAAAAAGARIRRTFGDGGRAILAGVTAVASLAASALGIQLCAVWAAIWECVRIGDDHFGSFRAAHSPLGGHLAAAFAGGVVLFWATALLAPAGSGAGDHLDPPMALPNGSGRPASRF